jgi:hypothetical protein
MSGITFFITLQARYRQFDNVYAAIAMIGVIGLTTDMTLAWLATVLFPWKRRRPAVRRAASKAAKPDASLDAEPPKPLAEFSENSVNPRRSEA